MILKFEPRTFDYFWKVSKPETKDLITMWCRWF